MNSTEVKTTELNYQDNAKKVLSDMGVKFTATFLKYGSHFDDDKESRDIYRVTFSRPDLRNETGIVRDGGRFSLQFGQSIKESTGGGGNPPTEYDVLTCLTKYDPETFENFCSEFGYDEDSRKAEKTYKAVVKEWEKVSRFFTSEELEILQEIQ
jgi:hypothetical protein